MARHGLAKRGTSRGGLTGIAVVLALVAGGAASAGPRGRTSGTQSLNPSTQIDLMVERVDVIEKQFDNLQSSIRGEPLSRSPAEVRDLLFEANFAFLTEDYEWAALLYYSLLDNGDLRGNSEEASAQFYLAEALFLSRNYYPAQEAFKEIVAAGQVHPWYDDAVMRLIEITGITGDDELFDYYYNNFLQTTRNSGPGALRVRYTLGRTLYRQGKLQEAKAMFVDFPKGSTYTSQARYHYGEILVREGYELASAGDPEGARQRYDAAIPVFLDVVDLPISTDEQLSVQHLGYLALGALYYEIGDLPAAIEAYQQIPNTSPFFADALFQICWAYINLGDFHGALRTIDIFLLAFPDDTREPELKLLAAHLRVKLEQYDQAVIEYRSVVADYEDIKKRLDHLVRSDIDPMIYFNQLVDKTFIVSADNQVPELAARVARQDARLDKAVRVAADLQVQVHEIAEGQEMVAELEDAVYGDSSADMMTAYRAKRQELDGVDARILEIESALVSTEANYLIDALGGESSAGILTIVERRKQLAEQVASVSSMYTDRTEYREDVEAMARAVDTEAYKVESMADDMLARIAGIEIYVKSQVEAGEMSDAEAAGHTLELGRLRQEIKDEQDLLIDAHRRLDPRRLTAGLGDESDDEEKGQRQQVRAQMADLVMELRGYRGQVGKANARQFFATVDDCRSRLKAIRDDSVSLRDDLDRRERDELDQIRRLISQEKSALASYGRDASDYKDDSTHVSGWIAKASFGNVTDMFTDTVLQADMGAIDVFWLQKEEITAQREAVRDERNRMLKELKKMYQGLLDFDEEGEEEDEEAWGLIE